MRTKLVIEMDLILELFIEKLVWVMFRCLLLIMNHDFYISIYKDDKQCIDQLIERSLYFPC